jgi:hypothetical protein
MSAWIVEVRKRPVVLERKRGAFSGCARGRAITSESGGALLGGDEEVGASAWRIVHATQGAPRPFSFLETKTPPPPRPPLGPFAPPFFGSFTQHRCARRCKKSSPAFATPLSQSRPVAIQHQLVIPGGRAVARAPLVSPSIRYDSRRVRARAHTKNAESKEGGSPRPLLNRPLPPPLWKAPSEPKNLS